MFDQQLQDGEISGGRCVVRRRSHRASDVGGNADIEALIERAPEADAVTRRQELQNEGGSLLLETGDITPIDSSHEPMLPDDRLGGWSRS